MATRTTIRRVSAGTGAALMVGGLATAGLLTACSSNDAVPADDEYVSNSTQSSTTDNGDTTYWQTDAGEEATDVTATGPYADGSYTASASYGPINEDSIDVTVTLENNTITDVNVVGHALLPTSERYQSAFASAISGTVVGKNLADANVDTVAGASKTSATFNRALNDIRQQATDAAAQ